MIKYVQPVNGAAKYFAGVDPDTNKPSVYMEDTKGYLSVIDTAKTIDKARDKAIKWQEKENKAVLKNQSKPHP